MRERRPILRPRYSVKALSPEEQQLLALKREYERHKSAKREEEV